jgi:nucleoside-diphosphate-sugar epimerase
MKVSVTGATGYLGHQLAIRLANKGEDVRVLARDPSSSRIPKHKNITVFKGDITNPDSLIPFLVDCQILFHTAALVKSWAKDRKAFYTINVDGTKNLLDASLHAGIKKFIFTSTCGVLGSSINIPMSESDPRRGAFDNDYELSKSVAERVVGKYHAEKGLNSVIVSPSRIYGPGIATRSLTLNGIIKRFVDGRITFIPKPATYKSNYCFINDVVNGHVLAAENGVAGEKYILGGENISYAGFFALLRQISGSNARLMETPKPIAEVYAFIQRVIGELTGNYPFYNAKGIATIYSNKCYTSSKAEKELGYKMTDLKTGLQRTINFFKNNACLE